MKMDTKKWAGLGLALASALTLSACYDDGYGYGGVSVGYGSGGYYDGYYDGYGYPYGWYNGFYYPGRGYWLYDRDGGRHRWSDHDQRHWEGRREAWRRDHGGRDWQGKGNWQGWRDRRPDANSGNSGDRWQGGRDRRPDASSGSGRWGRGGQSGAATSRPAPGPLGRVFRDRDRRD